MANTNPVADSPVVTDHVWHRGQQVGLVDVHPVGAVTVGLAGTELTEMGMMAAGAAQGNPFGLHRGGKGGAGNTGKGFRFIREKVMVI